jgi:hypothetical protein
MADNKSHMSERVREDLDKLTPEKKVIMLEAADRDPSFRARDGRMTVGTSATPVPKTIRRLGPSDE